jgi:hypothetical protein
MAAKNNLFREGLLWLAVKKYTEATTNKTDSQPANTEEKVQKKENAQAATQVTAGTTTKPLFDKTNTSSMMPYLEITIPGIFDSYFLPYENIIDFNYSINEHMATISFTDNTPIFIETILRQIWNERQGANKNFRILINFGWRVQEPPTNYDERKNRGIAFQSATGASESKKYQSSDKHGIVSSGRLEFIYTSATYDYTTSGVLATIVMHAAPLALLDASTVEKKQKLNKISNDKELKKTIEDILNQNVQNSDKEYNVVVQANNIEYKNLQQPKISFNGGETIREALMTIVDQLSISKADTTKQESVVKVLIDNKIAQALEDNDTNDRQAENSKDIVNIYIYNPDETNDSFIPLIEYPANESPVLEFSPNMEGSLISMFSKGDRYTTFDKLGNSISKVLPKPISGASEYNKEASNGQTRAVNSGEIVSNDKLDNIPRGSVANAKISVKLLGEPKFSDITVIYNASIEVRMNNIANTGAFLDNDDFFNNFPQLPNPRGKGLPLIPSYIPGETSPFNGFYKIQNITQKINPAEGFVTEIELLLFTEKL